MLLLQVIGATAKADQTFTIDESAVATADDEDGRGQSPTQFITRWDGERFATGVFTRGDCGLPG